MSDIIAPEDAPGAGGRPGKADIPASLARLGLLQGLTAVSSLLLFLLLVLAGRFLGAEDFGRLSFAMAFIFLFDVLLDPGLYHYLLREIARAPAAADRLLSHAVTWKLLAAPAVIVLAGGGAALIHAERTTVIAVLIMATAHVLRSFKEAMRAALLGRERFDLDAASTYLERGLLLGAGALLLLRGHGLLAFCALFVAVRVLDLTVIMAIVRRHICRFSVGRDPAFLRRMIWAAAPIAAFYVTVNLYNYVDTVMLSIWRTKTEVGWYNAAYRVYEGFFLFPGIIATVLMPRLSVAFVRDVSAFSSLFMRGVRYTALLGIAVGLNGVLLDGPFIHLSFGAEYDPAILSLRLLMLGMPVVFCLNFLQSAAIAMDRQKLILGLSLGGLAINVAANAVLIPIHGHVGAAAVTVFSESAVFIALLLALRRQIQGPVIWTTVLLPALAAGAPAALVGILLSRAPLLVQALLANLVLGAGGLMVLGTDERRSLRALARRLLRGGSL